MIMIHDTDTMVYTMPTPGSLRHVAASWTDILLQLHFCHTYIIGSVHMIMKRVTATFTVNTL